MEYFASTGNVVSSNLCVGSSKRIKILFLLLSIHTDELISTLKVLPSFFQRRDNNFIYSGFLQSFFFSFMRNEILKNIHESISQYTSLFVCIFFLSTFCQSNIETTF